MPIPIRADMSRVSHWAMGIETHREFAGSCRCLSNAKVAPAAALFEHGNHTTWIGYFSALGKCKNIEQWRARAIAANCPSEAALACRSTNDCGRLLALKFIADKHGDPVSADLQRNADFITPAASRYLA